MSPMKAGTKVLDATLTIRKKERIECRVTKEQKADILAAAKIDGLSVSDFMMKHSLDAARRLSLRERNSFVISEKYWPKLFQEEKSQEEKALIDGARACFKEFGIDYDKQGFDPV